MTNTTKGTFELDPYMGTVPKLEINMKSLRDIRLPRKQKKREKKNRINLSVTIPARPKEHLVADFTGVSDAALNFRK